MNRIRVDIPADLPFETRIPIRITDLNYGNHVGNDSFLALVHEARVQFLASLGYSELNLAGTGLIMTDAALEFKGEIQYGDLVIAAVGVASISRSGFDLLYRLTIQREQDTVLAARVKTGMLCYDYARRKSTQVPPDALEKLNTMLVAS